MEQENTEVQEEKVKSFDEVLQDSNYQSEFDKRVAKAIETSRAKWEEDYNKKLEVERTEAQKLAEMNAEQKLKYELEKERTEKTEAQNKLNAYELKDTAIRIAKEQNVDIGLLDLIDYGKENADTLLTKIEILKKATDKAVENAVNQRLKQDAPYEKHEEAKGLDYYYRKAFDNVYGNK